MRGRTRQALVASLVLFGAAAGAQAQDGPSVGEPLSKSDLEPKLKFDVPSSAGFAILGVSPESVLTPRKGSEFAIGLLNGLDQQGNFQSGIAIEANPYFWTLPERIQLDKYLNDKGYRLWSGFSFSLATASGQEDADKADRIGFGVNYTYDFDDPLFSPDLSKCIFRVQDEIGDEYLRERQAIGAAEAAGRDLDDESASAAVGRTADVARTGLIERLQKAGAERTEQCYRDLARWNRTVFQLGLAVHNSEVGGESPIDENGQSAWVSYSRGLGTHYQLTLHVDYGDDLLIANDDGLVRTDRVFGGLRLRVGSETLRGFLEAGYTDEDSDLSSDSFWKASVGAEIHVSSGVYLQLVYGDSFGANGEKDDFFSGQLKWAISPSSVFGGN